MKLSFIFPSRYTVITSTTVFLPIAGHLLHTAFVCSTTPRNPPHHSRAAQWNASNHVPCSDPAAPREWRHHGDGGWDNHGNVSRWVHSWCSFAQGGSPLSYVTKWCTWQNHTNVRAEGLVQVVCLLSPAKSGFVLFSSVLKISRDGGTTSFFQSWYYRTAGFLHIWVEYHLLLHPLFLLIPVSRVWLPLLSAFLYASWKQ